MRRTTKAAFGLVVLAAMLVLGAFSAGTASASLFLYTGPLPAKILFLSDNTQILKVENTSEESVVKCAHFGGEVLAPANSMSATTLKIDGAYHTCKIGAGTTVSVSPIEYEVTASGLVNVLKAITIAAVNGICTVKVPSGSENAANKALEKLLFLNNSNGDLLIHSDTNGIHSTTVGGAGACGKEGVEHTEGSYTGLVLVWAHLPR
jgi:hypothetical protein